MGAAAGVAAATWLNRRRLSLVNTSSDERVEPESAELPLGRSADPDVDEGLSRKLLPQDETSGGTLYAERESRLDESSRESLDDIWNAGSIDEGERGEGYDAVNPESLGAVWLERATQTAHESRLDAGNPNALPELEELMISEASLKTAGFAAGDAGDEPPTDDLTDDIIADDELDSGRPTSEPTDEELDREEAYKPS